MWIGGSLLGLAALAGVAVSNAAPTILINGSPSEPVGVYVRTSLAPERGRIIAFAAPPAAFGYLDVASPNLRRIPLLKAIAGTPGDRVCTDGGRLVINGADRGPILWSDRQGRGLPHWLGCRRLGPGEVFVFSDRVPNSFDSRYYGPVSVARILGVYREVLARTGAGA